MSYSAGEGKTCFRKSAESAKFETGPGPKWFPDSLPIEELTKSE
jgi:hypothetical protein